MSSFITTLNIAAADWIAALLRASWQGGLALALVWCVVRLLPRLSPRLQCWLWRLAYLKLLAAFLWSVPVVLPILPPSPQATSSLLEPASPHTSGSRISSPDVSTPDSATESALSSTASDVGPSAPHSRSALVAADAPNAVTPALKPRLSLAAFALLFWVGILLWQSVRLLMQWWATRRAYRACRLVQEGELLSVCSRLSHHLGLRQPPWLLAWQDADTPLLLGPLNPAIVLPEEMLASCRPEEQRLMLAHELAHVRRRDLLWAWLPLLACSLFCFHPLVWIGLHELTTAQEVDCDAVALDITRASVSDYGALLLRVAACRRPGARSGLVMVGMTESYHTLKRRLLAMKSKYPVSPVRFGLTGAALLALGIAGIVPWRVAAQVRPIEPQPTVPSAAASGSERPSASSAAVTTGSDAAGSDSSAASNDPTSLAIATDEQSARGAANSDSGAAAASNALEPAAAPGQDAGAGGAQSSGNVSEQSSGNVSGSAQGSGSSSGQGASSASGGPGKGTAIHGKNLQATAGKYTVYLDRTALVNVGGSGSAEISVNGVHFKPNLAVSLHVTAANSKDLQQLAGLLPQATAVEAGGARAATSLASAPDRLFLAGDEALGTLYLRLGDTGAKNLRTLEGALVVNDFKRTRFDLTENDLKPGAQRRVGDMTLKVEGFRSDDNGVQVDLSVTRPAPRVDPFTLTRDPQQLQALMMRNTPGIEAEMRDTNEHTYRPTAMNYSSNSGSSFNSSFSSFFGSSSNSSTSGSVSGSTSGNVSGSASGNVSGGSSGTGSSNNGVGSSSDSGSEQNQSAQGSRTGDGMEHQTIHLSFPAPANAPASLSVTLLTSTGKMERIPFKFTDVPLPSSH